MALIRLTERLFINPNGLISVEISYAEVNAQNANNPHATVPVPDKVKIKMNDGTVYLISDRNETKQIQEILNGLAIKPETSN